VTVVVGCGVASRSFFKVLTLRCVRVRVRVRSAAVKTSETNMLNFVSLPPAGPATEHTCSWRGFPGQHGFYSTIHGKLAAAGQEGRLRDSKARRGCRAHLMGKR